MREIEKMSARPCRKCGREFDPRRTPRCPTCLVEVWLGADEFVRPKHDPRLLPLEWESYRSVLSPDFVESPRPYLLFAAEQGAWYFDTHYDMQVQFTHKPLGRAPGSGIPAGRSMPEHALDSLLIAEADSAESAHAFAVSLEQFEAQIRSGEFRPLEVCLTHLCDQLQRPGSSRCEDHVASEKAATRPVDV